MRGDVISRSCLTSQIMSSLPLSRLVAFLNKELCLANFPKDDSANGLQVEGSGSVKRIGLAVDACDYVFQRAAECGVDFLLVHHGLIWGGIKSIRGLMKKRIQRLMTNGISLYACHLPLDWHPLYGNNAELLRILGIRKTGDFGEYHGMSIGYRGEMPQAVTLERFASKVNRTLGTETRYIDFGKKVKKIGVVSGGGWSALYDAEACGIDTFLTGEPAHSAYALAEELKVNLVFAGHYATETLGVKAAGRMIEKKFNTETVFIDHPTGL
jgi:dinuclear metal center YbgI/SA1388 family protein